MTIVARKLPITDGPHAAGYRRSRLSVAMIEDLVRLLEAMLIAGAGVSTFWARAASGAGTLMLPVLLVVSVTLAGLAATQALNGFCFRVVRAPQRLGWPVALAWCSVFAVLGVAYALLAGHPTVLAPWIESWAAAGLAALVTERCVLALLVNRLCRRGVLRRRTVVIGGGPYAEALLLALDEAGRDELDIIGRFDDRSDDRSPGLADRCPKTGTVDDLVDFARATPVDLVLVAMPISAEERLLTMLRKLWVLPVDIRLAAHMSSLKFRSRAYSYIGAVPVLDVADRPVTDWDYIAKSVFDRVAGLACLLVAAPVMLLVALAIKLESRGPVLFKQQRHGFNNQPVEIYKFRSMLVGRLDYDAMTAVTRTDPRVTRVGRWIRKTSLDELPQLFNVVFKGNLSLVGPRPHALRGTAENRLYNDVVDGYFARHRVVPGITGWAQINGWRGETDTADKIQKRVEYDLHYIENWSLGFDIYILAATVMAVFNTKNAY